MPIVHGCKQHPTFTADHVEGFLAHVDLDHGGRDDNLLHTSKFVPHVAPIMISLCRRCAQPANGQVLCEACCG